ncbi:MAG: hypothetical protein WB660_31440 [Candidatus Sulfotelmatobacter sp.]
MDHHIIADRGFGNEIQRNLPLTFADLQTGDGHRLLLLNFKNRSRDSEAHSSFASDHYNTGPHGGL